jgi:predicted  nucleic acid-binding Zn-ribbon protein
MTRLVDQLVELQRIDSLADQVRFRREHSPLRDDLAAANAELRAWERRHAELATQIGDLNDEIDRDDIRGGEIAAHLERLERQLKTVIAPREAEALMHEIATLTSERDELDLAELEAMEQQSGLESAMTDHATAESALRSAVENCSAAVDALVADSDQQLAALDADRSDAFGVIPADVQARYERTRQHLGVAVAQLVGTHCVPCNLERSAAEIDTARADAADSGFADCQECGRFLVI